MGWNPVLAKMHFDANRRNGPLKVQNIPLVKEIIFDGEENLLFGRRVIWSFG